jgi:hypothetical protein
VEAKLAMSCEQCWSKGGQVETQKAIIYGAILQLQSLAHQFIIRYYSLVTVKRCARLPH